LRDVYVKAGDVYEERVIYLAAKLLFLADECEPMNTASDDKAGLFGCALPGKKRYAGSQLLEKTHLLCLPQHGLNMRFVPSLVELSFPSLSCLPYVSPSCWIIRTFFSWKTFMSH
jgi:hypothetical protein